MREVWKGVPDYEGLYLVSSHGRVKSKRSGRLMPGYTGARGYHQICLSKGRGQRTWDAHRLVVLAFIGPIKKGLQVNHKDGDKRNNRLTNLEIVTPSENNMHAIVTGLKKIPHGSKWHAAKLVEPQVIRIKKLLAK